MKPIDHQAQIAHLSKKSMVAHLIAHGSANPSAVMEKWTKDELLSSHEFYHREAERLAAR